jgi:CheY-like chemotaxis protein
VLLVHPHAVQRAIFERWLRSWGLEVESADVPGAATARLGDGGARPDFALLSCGLPAEPLEACATALRAAGGIPFAWLGVPNDTQERDRLTALGGRAFVGRTLRSRALLRAIEETLGLVAGAPETSARAAHTELPAGLRVLLVEDNAVNRKVAVRMLQQKGVTPDIAINGLEAVEAWEQTPYDVVLMDVQMPVMDGYQATHEIRQRELRTHRRTAILAMTANAMAGDRERCLAAGMDDFLTKPVRAEHLYEMLASWAGRTGGAEAA